MKFFYSNPLCYGSTDSGGSSSSGDSDSTDKSDSWLGSVGSWFTSLGDRLVEGIKTFASDVKQGLSDFKSSVASGFQNVKSWLSDLGENIGGFSQCGRGFR